jgi:hypothetical protein
VGQVPHGESIKTLLRPMKLLLRHTWAHRRVCVISSHVAIYELNVCFQSYMSWFQLTDSVFRQCHPFFACIISC